MTYGYMERLIEEYEEEQREQKNAELRERLARNRSTEELFARLKSLAPKRAGEKEPALV